MKVRIAGVALAVMLLVGLFASMALAMPNEPTVTPVTKQQTVTLYPATSVTTGTVYSTAAPNTDAFGRDISAVAGWSAADVFVNVDCTGACSLVATVQLSADGVNWTTADYEYVANTTTSSTAVITSTSEATTTLTTSGAIAYQSYARTLSADGTEYMRVPLSGEYLRVQLVAVGVLTPTVKATYRN